MKIQITQLAMTCSACPSQWEGTTVGGGSVYIRYRYGWLTASVGPDLDSAVLPIDQAKADLLAEMGWTGVTVNGGTFVYDDRIGDEYDGVLSDAEMRRLLGDVFEFPPSTIGSYGLDELPLEGV